MLVVHDQVEADVSQVHLLHHVEELRPLQYLKSVSIDIKNAVRLNLSMAALHQTLVANVLTVGVLGMRTVLFEVKAFNLFVPFFLDDLDHCVLLGLLLGSSMARLGSEAGLLFRVIGNDLRSGKAALGGLFSCQRAAPGGSVLLACNVRYQLGQVVRIQRWELVFEDVLQIRIFFNRVAFKSKLTELRHRC